MKKCIIILLILIPGLSLAQSNIREIVFTHLSSTELLVGETLHFKSYLQSEQTGKLSELSRILYVEILNASGSPVYQTKLEINSGQCAGSFFVPTDLETGNYQFVAYTRWMKNFDEFFHESLTIINPYISQKFQQATVLEMNVQIAVEGERLLSNAKNKIVIRVTDQFQRGISRKGKIVSNKERESIEVATDEFGFSSFYITPDFDESYQLILEKDHGFEFIDLPKPCKDCIQLRVIQTADLWVIKSTSINPEDFTQGQVEVFKNQESVFSSPIVLNSALSIHKNDLPNGLLRVVYIDDEGKGQERLIWNEGAQPDENQSFGIYKTKSTVEEKFSALPASNLSISVEQVDTRREALGIFWYGEVGSKIDQILPHSFYQNVTENQLDNLLLTSNYTGGLENPEEVKYLPEYRSGIVQGQVTNRENETIIDVPVGLAFSGINRQMSVTTTDSSGRFVLTYDLEVSDGEPVIDILSEVPNVEISIEPEYYVSYPEFTNIPVVFDSAKVAAIVKRSINNQIMNAYYVEEKEGSTKAYRPQFDQVKSYKLDDFTRFNTMRDTFIELIVEVGVSKNEEKYEFKMRSKELVNGFYEEYPTLLLLDGAFVSSEDLMNLSPYLVDRIDVINHKYYFGKSIFDGILSVHTVAKDKGGIASKGMNIDLVPVQMNDKSPIVQVTQEVNSRIPAYQDLLYWDPAVYHTGGSLQLDFSTSDVKGMFEIRVEGISVDGNALSHRAYFTVE
ncbi:MAG: hypothetical protein R8N23_05645 [Reichenbachiella sp.]|uniref:hypothetical protein n=1 Tax=Reichenbachiella sp. TaxID=2184521 RepID=UPI0029669534|nr:hypothetical protein [Reichenbachiella sp.]MDW3209328.1 hypothetical protein [Reichenbachiella sp.]